MTLQHVARQANVSVATVSNALAGKGGMTDTTRKRVCDIARQLGYRPNVAARALVTGRKFTVGLVAGRTNLPDDTWLARIAAGLVQTLERRDYHLMMFYAEPTDQRIKHGQLEDVVDGLVVGFTVSDKFIKSMRRRNLPIVAVDTEADTSCDSVCFDYQDAAAKATAHLVGLGHQRIAYVGSYHKPVAAKNRTLCDGCRGAMRAAKLKPMRGGAAIMPVAQRIEQLLADKPPTGLVCYNDEIALQAMRELHARKLAVPTDVSTVSIDDIGYVDTMLPALTTVRMPMVEMGEQAAALILGRINEDRDDPRRVVLAGELIVRESTASPKAKG